MIKIKTTVSLCIGILLLSSGTPAQTLYVPVNHWVYDYLDRMEAKRLLPIVLSNSKPMTRAEIVDLLLGVDDRQLSRVDRDLLRQLQLEFQDEYARRGKTVDSSSRWTRLLRHPKLDPLLPNLLYANGRDLAEFQLGPMQLFLDPVFARSRQWAEADTLEATERVFGDTNGFRLWGTIGKFGFYTDIRDSREWGTRAYPPRNASAPGLGFVQGNGEQIYHDETDAYLVYHHDFLTLQFGKDKNAWGPGRAGQLALSTAATSYDQFKLQLGFERLKFTSIIGWLRHYDDRSYYDGDPGSKMLAAHRLECAPWHWLSIGLHETLIYAGDLRPAYANPVMFFRSAEHYLGDTDNAAMGADVEVKLIAKTKVYGELFIDDLRTGLLSSDHYSKKLGGLGGLYHVDLFGIPQLDGRIEYARIRPYVYTHKYNVTRYDHFGTGLGHRIGPNAEEWTMQLQWQPQWRWRALLLFQRMRKGGVQDEINWGGDISEPHAADDPEYVPFLAGTVKTQERWQVSVAYQAAYNLFLTAAASTISWEISGTSQSRRQMTLGFLWNY